MTSRPDPTDERLLNAHDLARTALREVTPAASIGDAAGYTLEEGGVVSLRFNNRLGGYPGWFWTVSIAVVEDAEPTVLEVELLPGDGALLAPEWVPWGVRLAEYHATQAANAALAAESGEDVASDDDLDDEDGEDVDDLDDLDASDFDDDGSAILHGGDLDGVDIDELDESADADDDNDNDDADEDDNDEDDDDNDDDEDDDEDDDDDSDDDSDDDDADSDDEDADDDEA